MSLSPEMLEEDPLLPLLPLAARAVATLLSWSTWIVLGRGRAVGRPAVLLDRSLGTGRALTGSGIRWPCRKKEDGRHIEKVPCDLMRAFSFPNGGIQMNKHA